MSDTAHMEARIALKYSGPAVVSGLMDVYEAAANMIAFSDFMVATAKACFGESATAKAEVAGYGRGSFVTDFLINFAPTSATLLSTAVVTPGDLWGVIKGAFDVWKHLKGSPPQNVIQNPGDHSVNIVNNSGQVLNVSIESATVVFSEKASEATAKFIKEALSKGGIDGVKLLLDDGEPQRHQIVVDSSEGQYFHGVAPSQSITDQTIRMGLVIEAPVFKDGNKWRFFDGQQSFFADIDDVTFMDRVNSGERFGKGDVLYADVRINQEQSGMKISATRTIMKVHEHRISPVQSHFPFR
jgi:hypothetical protein